MTVALADLLHGIETYHTQLLRSLLLRRRVDDPSDRLAYPVAYWIAFRGGKRKSTYLFLLLLPFFVSFVLRTISWQFLLSDNGILLGPLKHAGLLPQNFHILATSVAVIGGLTYNYLPFMVLPALRGAGAGRPPGWSRRRTTCTPTGSQAFRKVVFPLSLPGVFAGVLITFVPAASDYVNASILGGTQNTMIGNIIQNLYLINQTYPQASALSFTLMAVLLIGIFIYARALGTEEVLEAAAQ